MHGLDWFKHIILVSSHQDTYSPYDSSRIQLCKNAAKIDSEKSNVYIAMAQNLLEGLSAETITRLDVNFDIKETSIDSLIGRTAHI